ncbi:MAG TPA: hypothetical protein VMS98_11225 [Thermoanaerobaculia bacterium]|nr:hypothetical protein [Thermoanaerobaculia bacterium]
MPLLLALGLILIVFVVTAVIVPFAIVFRYRFGTKRRRARMWVATLNVFSLAGSAAIYSLTAALTGRWVPDALSYALAGLAAGGVLGLLGLALSRWERERDALYYTPSRLLVLAISIVVTARLAYGLWRASTAWRSTGGAELWVAEAGIGGSIAAGAVVVGYYLVYWAGVRSRAARALRD